MNTKFFCLYDFETTSQGSKPDPKTDEPIQLTAIMIHPRKLEIVDGGRFNSFIRPPDGFVPHEESVKWHAKVRKTTPEAILNLWGSSQGQKEVWSGFKNFLERFHTQGGRKSIFSAPIRCGFNIIGYDNVIWQRICERYNMVDKDGKQNLVMDQFNIDLMHILFTWFENNIDIDKNNMDVFREYFGISGENAHDSEKDCEDEANILIRFLKLQRYIADKTTFKGSFRKPI
jgi:hypothetical protein